MNWKGLFKDAAWFGAGYGVAKLQEAAAREGDRWKDFAGFLADLLQATQHGREAVRQAAVDFAAGHTAGGYHADLAADIQKLLSDDETLAAYLSMLCSADPDRTPAGLPGRLDQVLAPHRITWRVDPELDRRARERLEQVAARAPEVAQTLRTYEMCLSGGSARRRDRFHRFVCERSEESLQALHDKIERLKDIGDRYDTAMDEMGIAMTPAEDAAYGIFRSMFIPPTGARA